MADVIVGIPDRFIGIEGVFCKALALPERRGLLETVSGFVFGQEQQTILREQNISWL